MMRPRFILRATLLVAASAIVVSLHNAQAQNPLDSLPNNYKLIFDNQDISVIRVHYGPHEKVAVHDHSNYSTLYVYLNDSGEVRFSHDEKPPFVMVRPATKTGSFRISPARPERHSVENLSDKPSDYLRIEFKKLPLDGLEKPFRGPVLDPLKPGDSVEFHNSGLTIRRIFCNPRPACTIPAPAKTLLVTLSPSILLTDDLTKPIHNNFEKQIQNGEVVWEQNATTLRIGSATQVPAHILAISLAFAQR